MQEALSSQFTCWFINGTFSFCICFQQSSEIDRIVLSPLKMHEYLLLISVTNSVVQKVRWGVFQKEIVQIRMKVLQTCCICIKNNSQEVHNDSRNSSISILCCSVCIQLLNKSAFTLYTVLYIHIVYCRRRRDYLPRWDGSLVLLTPSQLLFSNYH